MKKILSLTAAFVLLASTAIVLLPRQAEAGTFPGKNGRIVFAAGTSGDSGDDYDIYTIKTDGSDLTTLIDDDYRTTRPVYSPDGTKIAYDSSSVGGSEIFIMNADGSGQTKLTDIGFSYMGSFSPDGNHIYFTALGGSGYEINRIDIDGSNRVELTDAPTNLRHPSVSPDGEKIVYEIAGPDNEIGLMDIDGSNQTQIVTNDDHDFRPIWHPDGDKIVWSTLPDDASPNYQLNVMDADGSNQARLSPSTDDYDYSGYYSPDGQKIAFTSHRDGSYDIYFGNAADMSSVSKIVDNDAYVGIANWISWQPLTIEPSSDSEDLVLEVGSDGTASLDVDEIFTDAYGEGIGAYDVTSQPSQGSISQNGSVITYTQDDVANSSFWSNISSFFFPSVSAQSADDSFDLEVCSGANTSLCTNATVSVSLTASSSGSGSGSLADTGISQTAVIAAASVLFTLAALFPRLLHRNNS